MHAAESLSGSVTADGDTSVEPRRNHVSYVPTLIGSHATLLTAWRTVCGSLTDCGRTQLELAKRTVNVTKVVEAAVDLELALKERVFSAPEYAEYAVPHKIPSIAACIAQRPKTNRANLPACCLFVHCARMRSVCSLARI